MTHTVTSQATVSIERPARYGKQLVNHLKRKSGGEWDAEQEQGWINLLDQHAEVKVAQDQPDTLQLHVAGSEDTLDRLEYVVGRHLVRFATTLTVEVAWHRDNGTPGSVQTTESEAD